MRLVENAAMSTAQLFAGNRARAMGYHCRKHSAQVEAHLLRW